MMTGPEEEVGLDPARLAARLQDPASYVRISALAELVKPRADALPILEAVTAGLDDPDPSVRHLAAIALGQVGAPAVPALARALEERQSLPVRIAAASGLARAGAAAATAVAALADCLRSADEVLRFHAAMALGKIGPAAVPALRGLLASGNPEVRGAALDALGFAGAGASGALEDVRALLASGGPSSEAAAYAMIKISGDASAGLPSLLAQLEAADERGRARIVERIGTLRKAAGGTTSQLTSSLSDDPAPDVRGAAALALARTGTTGPETLAALSQALSDPEPEVRAQAGIALSALGTAAASVLPALRLVQDDADAKLAAIARAAAARIAGFKSA